MNALPNPFVFHPFVLDEDQFLYDVLGTHPLPKVEPLPLEAFRELLAS